MLHVLISKSWSSNEMVVCEHILCVRTMVFRYEVEQDTSMHLGNILERLSLLIPRFLDIKGINWLNHSVSHN